MTQKNHLPIGKFYVILLITGILVMIASIEVMFQVKDGELFLQWVNQEYPVATPDSELFTQYVSSNLSIYFLKVIIPGSIAVTAYLAATRSRFTGILTYIWVVLSFGGLAYTTAGMNLQSVFFYLNAIFYIGLILFIYFVVGISADNTGGED